MTAKILPFPKCVDRTCCPDDGTIPNTIDTNKDHSSSGPAHTLFISDSVFAAPPEAFKWPSAGPVDPKYAEALRKQKNNG